MKNMVKPKGITLNKTESYLEIIWSDNRVCRYPLSHLREACPCVECRGGHANMGAHNDPDDILKLTPARSYKVEDLQLIGNYALQPVWDDGHNSGLYTWEYLYKIYPDDSNSEENG